MQKYFKEAKQLLVLAIPVILSQTSQTAMGFVDTTMAGHRHLDLATRHSICFRNINGDHANSGTFRRVWT